METINRDDCLHVGYVQKTHGIHGELVIQLETDIASLITGQRCIYLEIDGLLVPFFFDGNAIVRSSRSVIIKLEDIDVIEKATEYVGCKIYIDQEELDKEKIEVELLVGFEVEDVVAGLLGKVSYIDDYSGNVVMAIDYKGEELLIPLHDEFIISLSSKKRKITLQCPEGLLNLNEHN